MRDLLSRLGRTTTGRYALQQLAAVALGAAVALVLAATLLVFGTSGSTALEDAYEPASTGGQ